MGSKAKKHKKKEISATLTKVNLKSKTILKRKQLRKEKKQAKKASKRDFFQKKFCQTKKLSEEDDEEIPSSDEEGGKKLVLIKEKSIETKKVEVNKKTEDEMKKLSEQQKKQRKKQLTQANEEELKNIQQLEKQLGLKKRKSKNLPKSFLDDGLDYILDACDSAKLGQMKDLSEDEEAEKTVEVNLGDNYSSSSDDDDLIEGIDYDFESDEEKEVNMEVEESQDNHHDFSDYESNAEQDQMSGDECDDEADVEDEVEPNSSGEDTSKDIWEDIYGRKRDTDGNIIKETNIGNDLDIDSSENPEPAAKSKYIPPALRNKHVTDSEASKATLLRLKKQLKGMLNRLAETNMVSISKQVEGLYREHSRNDLNMILTDLLLFSLVGPTVTPIRLVMEHVLLLAILHANVGTEVGAQILQTVVRRFNEEYDKADIAIKDKTLDNLAVIIAYIYNFKIAGARLVFDLLNKLSDRFKAKDIELIVIMLRNSGFVLRKDDPAALKTFILKVQSQATACSEGEDPRVQFMLEVLMAIKNNNVNKIPNYDPSHFEHLKKNLKTYLREGNYVTELKIGFLDLVQADTRGRWWIVGSAFAGNLSGQKVEAGEENSQNKQVKLQFSDKILDLAHKMRMNTETRRHIFCLVMTAEDYLEGAEKLVKLGTKNQVQREVVFVVTDCCLQETEYNPFYAHLTARLANLDRKYRVATQFHVWDRLRQVKDLKKSQLVNLANFTAFLISEKAQSIGVLKVIEFAEMNKYNVRFLKIVLTKILLDQDQEKVEATFKAVSDQKNLEMFRESLRLFMHHFLVRQSKDVNLKLVKDRVELAEKALMSASSKLRL